MDNFDYNRMKAVSIEDAEVIQESISRSDFPSCEYTFSNLYIWQPVYRTVWTLFNGHLYLHMPSIDELLYPCGGGAVSPEELYKVSEGMIRAGFSGTIFHFPEGMANPDPALYTCESMGEDQAEYIYKTETLAELKGSHLSPKRNLIRQFLRNNPEWRIEEITKEDFRNVVKLTEHWEQEHEGQRGIEDEKTAISRALEHFDFLGLHGIALFSKNEICAYSVFSRINRDSFTEQFEKTDRKFKGASQMITHQTAIRLRTKCPWLNREQDLGIPGLRRAKQSYMPERMLRDNQLKVRT